MGSEEAQICVPPQNWFLPIRIIRYKKKTTPVTLAPIAKPLAGKKLCKRSFKLVRRAAENKCLKRGVTEVVKRIRRGNKGICIIAGNISPIDIITHVPILCEEAEVPYFYVPLKEDLATAGNTKRPTCCVLVQMKPAKGELAKDELEKLKSDYDQVVADVSELNSSLFGSLKKML
ncbi:H/ACA ribonucleoprotein complex subunit 2-like protein, partial [Linum grandiflorum]